MRILGASVRGPAHTAERRPNEDAWLGQASAAGTWAVVCDGVGSRTNARLGAQAGTRAARRAWTLWRRSPSARPEDFVRLVEVLWRLELGDVAPETACTTMLFAGIRKDGSGFCAQLGDGLVGYTEGGDFHAVSPERGSFSSVTLALGAPHGLKDWVVESWTGARVDSAIMLASDGIADDLHPGRYASFLAWLLSDFANLEDGGSRLRRVFRSWPVPHHRDDKTLVLLWNPSER